MVSGAQARAVAAARRQLRREVRGDRGVADAVARVRAAGAARTNRVTNAVATTEYPAPLTEPEISGANCVTNAATTTEYPTQLTERTGTGANCAANSAAVTDYPAQFAAAVAPASTPTQRSAA